MVSALAQKLKAQYPQMEIHYKNGYGKDKDADFREIEALQPDLVLVALGVPAQEKLIARHPGEVFQGRVHRRGRVLRCAVRQ